MAFDAVFILGKELRRDRDRALRELRARAAAAAIAWRRGAGLVISLEAPLQGQEQAGSAIVAEMLRELGLPDEALHLERVTRSTREEAVESLRVVRARAPGRLLALTSAYHVPRARRYFREVHGDGALVAPPELLLEHARPIERDWILAGVPGPAAMADELPVEATLSTLARLLRPLPAPVAWPLEVWAGGLWRGVDAARQRVREPSARSARSARSRGSAGAG